MKKQQTIKERIYSIETRAGQEAEGFKLSAGQIEETKNKIKEIYKKPCGS
jgi:hypothetical protein